MDNLPFFEESQSPISKSIKSHGAPTDFTIVCGRIMFPVHRAMLGASSNFLLELFLKEQNGSFNFIVHDVQPIDVENLLTFVYQAKVGVQPNHSDGLLKAAQQLKIDELIKEVEKSREDSIRVQEEQMEMIRLNDFMPLLEREGDIEIVSPHMDLSQSNPSQSQNNSKSKSGQLYALKIPQDKPLERAINKEIVTEESKSPTEIVAKVRTVIQAPMASTTTKGRNRKSHNTTPFPRTKTCRIVNARNVIPIMNEEELVPIPNIEVPIAEPVKPLTITNIRKQIGRPILSSTKLSPQNPIVPDMPKKITEKLKPVLQQRAYLIETVVDLDVSERNKENGTYVVSGKTEHKNLNRKLGKRKRIVVTPRKKLIKKFCVADLIENPGNQGANDPEMPNPPLLIKSTAQLQTEKAQVIGTLKPTPKGKLILKPDGKVVKKQKFSKKVLKNRLPPPLTTSEEHGGEKIRRFAEFRKRTLPKSARNTDDSSGSEDFKIGKLRRKVPAGKRRRIPASNRPLIVSSTFNNTTKPIVRRPNKPAPTNLVNKEPEAAPGGDLQSIVTKHVIRSVVD